MDTSLNIQSAANYHKPVERVSERPVVQTVSANLRPAAQNVVRPDQAIVSAGGKTLPQDQAKGANLPASSLKPAPKSPDADSAKPSELSRLAVALVAEFGSSSNIERTEQAVEKLNEILKDRERDLEFSIDEDTGRTILKVIHAESGEVIRQIPPEELLNIARTFIEGTGTLIEDQA
ncbi:flagellar protein FlaG [Zhongshania sp. BJYM1]|uniref:flagellar protein FlaG n=1 Tax=Zhongshania aquatica TaxID=2965069 RepID=UPI0022B4A25F|nr:flagellar protein FlaG [Marortus sp. BJYM1]